ncbi:hypothetical protein OF829_18290 [Sphingomonas sp. LB-2]|uniref:hypothetical protein n=1 Tax=Sphingomonas caeni TaxID=2984949 RepID=UPI0022319336|nr:hypothetical protein [Sphingomonas caeni]MCW3849193.1 hypothetical protein [Sphingomonas caeni]
MSDFEAALARGEAFSSRLREVAESVLAEPFGPQTRSLRNWVLLLMTGLALLDAHAVKFGGTSDFMGFRLEAASGFVLQLAGVLIAGAALIAYVARASLDLSAYELRVSPCRWVVLQLDEELNAGEREFATAVARYESDLKVAIRRQEAPSERAVAAAEESAIREKFTLYCAESHHDARRQLSTDLSRFLRAWSISSKLRASLEIGAPLIFGLGVLFWTALSLKNGWIWTIGSG